MSTKKVLITILLVASTVACYSWHTEPLSPARPITTLTSPVLRLTLLDGRRYKVAEPHIARDTLRAWDLASWDFATPVPVIVPVSQIQRLETRHFSPAKTTALAVGVPVGLLAVAFLIISSSLGGIGCIAICSP